MGRYTSRAAEALANFLSSLPREEASKIVAVRADLANVLNNLGFTIDELTEQDLHELRSNFG